MVLASGFVVSWTALVFEGGATEEPTADGLTTVAMPRIEVLNAGRVAAKRRDVVRRDAIMDGGVECCPMVSYRSSRLRFGG